MQKSRFNHESGFLNYEKKNYNTSVTLVYDKAKASETPL